MVLENKIKEKEKMKTKDIISHIEMMRDFIKLYKTQSESLKSPDLSIEDLRVLSILEKELLEMAKNIYKDYGQLVDRWKDEFDKAKISIDFENGAEYKMENGTVELKPGYKDSKGKIKMKMVKMCTFGILDLEFKD